MKIMIEVSGGVVCNVTSTQECSIYLIDHDNLKERGHGKKVIKEAKEAMQPDCITWEEGQDETPEFDMFLEEALEAYHN